LSGTLAIFKIPLDAATAKPGDLLEHHFSMQLSKCFRESGGKLSCLTCHNPHASLLRENAAAFYKREVSEVPSGNQLQGSARGTCARSERLHWLPHAERRRRVHLAFRSDKPPDHCAPGRTATQHRFRLASLIRF
jgi:hypothetical protein